VMINVRDVDRELIEAEPLKAAVANVEEKLAGAGRVLLRASGTEPLVRVMVEGEVAEQVQGFAEQLAERLRAL